MRIAEALRVFVRRIDPGLPMPQRARLGDAGFDLRAAHAVRIEPGERAVVGTGIAVAIPEGHVGLITPRSGLAALAGLSMVNAPGVIDSGYRGEVKLILVNLDPHSAVEIRRGDRVAQLLVVPLGAVELEEAAELPTSERGEGGLGSTGL